MSTYFDFSLDGCLRFLCSKDCFYLWKKNDLSKINRYCKHLIEEIVSVKRKIEFQKVRVRVTNADCDQIELFSYAGYGSTIISTPTQNQWYDISHLITGNTDTNAKSKFF